VSAGPVSPRGLWRLAAGFSIWGTALLMLYALHAVGCTFAWSAGMLRLGLVAVLLVHLVALGWMWHCFARDEIDPAFGEADTFLHVMAVWTVISAFAVTILTLGPPLMLTVCL
jgi:hypothetical protein